MADFEALDQKRLEAIKSQAEYRKSPRRFKELKANREENKEGISRLKFNVPSAPLMELLLVLKSQGKAAK